MKKLIFILLLSITSESFSDWKLYALDLEEQGYSREASEHISKVEFKMIPLDFEYVALMED